MGLCTCAVVEVYARCRELAVVLLCRIAGFLSLSWLLCVACVEQLGEC